MHTFIAWLPAKLYTAFSYGQFTQLWVKILTVFTAPKSALLFKGISMQLPCMTHTHLILACPHNVWRSALCQWQAYVCQSAAIN